MKDSTPAPPFAIALTHLAGSTRSVSGSPLEDEVVSLFDQLRNPLLRYLLTFGLTADDGEEVVQEVFLALFQHLRGGKSRANLRGWLFRVAHNMALKRRQRIQRSPETSAASAGNEEAAVDAAPTPEDQMLSNELHRRLLAVVEVLPEADRRCLFLRAEGLRYREIAEVMDISLGAVSLSLSRTLARVTRASQR